VEVEDTFEEVRCAVENDAERGANQSALIQILQWDISEKDTMPEPIESGGMATIEAEGSDPRADTTLVQHVLVVQPLVESGAGPAADGTLESKLQDGGVTWRSPCLQIPSWAISLTLRSRPTHSS
jgi:hypothetical protein